MVTKNVYAGPNIVTTQGSREITSTYLSRVV